ncbi:hypothetical protein CRG98_024208 [Punica granatum]|uniref:Uncharacterized protein n=1 Tax=Punica granatum TaxID=22663 RepID=A0A2I0JGL0_PUNGR|nr:hypothetical protein CRG98_024208 [Punica granatum]
MKALLVRHGLEGALEGEKKLPAVTSKEEDEAYRSFVDTMLYGKTSITLEDVKALLNWKELQKKVMEHHGDNGKGLLARGRSSEKGSRGHLKKDCPRRRGKQGDLSENAVFAEERKIFKLNINFHMQVPPVKPDIPTTD